MGSHLDYVHPAKAISNYPSSFDLDEGNEAAILCPICGCDQVDLARVVSNIGSSQLAQLVLTMKCFEGHEFDFSFDTYDGGLTLQVEHMKQR